MGGFEAMEENLRATFAVFSRARPDGAVRQFSGLAAICSGVRFSTFNAVLLTSPVESAEELCGRIEPAAGYFRERDLPWSLWLCEEWLQGRLRKRARRVLEQAGLRLLIEMPGMAAGRLRPPSRPLPPLVFRPVQEEAARQAFQFLMSAAFEVPAAVASQIYGAEQTWQDGLTGWVAYWDGCAVATAATRVAGGVIGLYAVGTLPAFRRQGCAEAIVRHALGRAQAASGLEESVLQSTAAAVSLYQKLGYRSVARYSVYVSNR